MNVINLCEDIINYKLNKLNNIDNNLIICKNIDDIQKYTNIKKTVSIALFCSTHLSSF